MAVWIDSPFWEGTRKGFPSVSREKIIFETLLCFKRAGADGILTYAAIDVAKRLREG